ncbi:MAG: portal protein, partial [Candidatus Poseidoniales archaeon]
MDYDIKGQTVAGWIMHKCEQWRDHYESNYSERFDEYYRLWRGIWSAEDTLRQSERSRLISPALQQAVESATAEVEEATFGRGRFFNIKDDVQDQETGDIVLLQRQLDEDFSKTQVRKNVSETILNSAVFGTGIAELTLEEMKEMRPATRPAMNGELTAVGVETQDRFVVKVRSVLPQNFLIDPVATSIQEALGVAIDEFVPKHQVEMLVSQGVYNDVVVEASHEDSDLEPDQELTIYSDDKVRLTKYYGLIPRYLFDEYFTDEDEEIEELIDEESDEPKNDEYIEVVAVIANGGQLLKLEANPYMMGDRPVIAFSWDTVPGRFWGRGICEKGYNSQKALDTELRARIDALALTVHPMLAVDASRLPRGSKMEVRPGKAILTNGNPSEILKPFQFGQLDQVSFAQGKDLMQMVQQATGSIDAAGIPGSINSQSTAAGISMGLGAIIKRHKRTLLNFQESFLI